MIEHRSPISGIAAHGDRWVATAGYDNQVVLWEQGSRTPVNRVLHDHLANQCSFNADGTLLVTSSSDYTARIWSVPDLRLHAVLNDQADDVEMSVFHPTRDLVATASRDHVLRVYDTSGAVVARFVGHKADVISVEWSTDGEQVITSSDDGTVKRWSLARGELLEDLDLGGVETDTVAIGRDGTLYAGNDDGAIVVIGPEGQTTVPAHDSGIKRLVLDDARHLMVSLSYDRSMGLWDTSGGSPRRIDQAALPNDVWPRSCAFAAGTTLVFGTFGARYRTYDYGRREWFAEEVPPTHGVNAVCWADGGVLTVGDAGVVRRDGVVLAQMGSLCNFIAEVGPLLITGGQLGTVLDARTGEQLHQHVSPLNCAAAFERDGVAHVVVGAYTGEGLVFRVVDGRLEHVVDVPLHANAVKGVAVAAGLIFSVCADSGVAWHRVEDFGQEAALAQAHDRIANGCVGFEDGSFASVGRDLKLRLWGPDRTASVVRTDHPNSIKCIAGDGVDLIATGSYHGHVKIYDRRAERWVAQDRPTTSGIASLCHVPGTDRFLAGSYDGNVYELSGASG